MSFGFLSKDKNGLPPLTEQDIRSRLYGSAVGVAENLKEKPEKKHKPQPENKPPAAQKKPDDEPSRLDQELALLKKELEDTKKKLKRMRGVRSKKIRLLLVSFGVFAGGTILLTFIVKGIIHMRMDRPASSVPSAAAAASSPVSNGRYAIQVATYTAASQAEAFSNDLKAKGYSTFIKKSKYESGKDKLIIYVGSFNSKADATRMLGKLKSRERIEDSFIVNLPK